MVMRGDSSANLTRWTREAAKKQRAEMDLWLKLPHAKWVSTFAVNAKGDDDDDDEDEAQSSAPAAAAGSNKAKNKKRKEKKKQKAAGATTAGSASDAADEKKGSAESSSVVPASATADTAVANSKPLAGATAAASVDSASTTAASASAEHSKPAQMPAVRVRALHNTDEATFLKDAAAVLTAFEEKQRVLRTDTAKQKEKRFCSWCSRPSLLVAKHYGLTEAVASKLMACAGCNNAFFCSADCQRAHWKWLDHKSQCKSMKAGGS